MTRRRAITTPIIGTVSFVFLVELLSTSHTIHFKWWQKSDKRHGLSLHEPAQPFLAGLDGT